MALDNISWHHVDQTTLFFSDSCDVMPSSCIDMEDRWVIMRVRKLLAMLCETLTRLRLAFKAKVPKIQLNMILEKKERTLK